MHLMDAMVDSDDPGEPLALPRALPARFTAAYERGLAALLQQRYAEAVREFKLARAAAHDAATIANVDRLLALLIAELERGPRFPTGG